jgi:diguanylate cyclase (GGDEF)-like protein
MDVLTASTALIVVQLCIALVMGGIFYASPAEKCTRYWALSGVTVATGVLAVVLNGGAPRPLLLNVGNNLLILGGIFQWCGIRHFYRKPRGYAGWILGAMFFVLFGAGVLNGAHITYRSLLSAVFVLALLALNFREIINGRMHQASYARVLALGALGIMIAAYSIRVFLSLARADHFPPNLNSPLAVLLLYLVPIGGTLLFSNALLLMYFERMVADKHHLATHDDLTGLLNRRALVTGGERELRLATRLELPIAVAFVDIDHFKSINDRYGHEVGDEIITEVAGVLKSICRNIDLVGRYGGEEFCLVFPGADAGNAQLIGERLVQAVRAHAFPLGLQVTISVGVAALAGDADDRAWASLVRRADQQLYQAKDAGRDCYRMAV